MHPEWRDSNGRKRFYKADVGEIILIHTYVPDVGEFRQSLAFGVGEISLIVQLLIESHGQRAVWTGKGKPPEVIRQSKKVLP